MIKRFLHIVVFTLISLQQAKAQTYPQYSQQPLGISPDISGGFCVMRSHHFHLGLDFRTQRKEGFNIYAVEEGYVKRIKISHYGYGRLIQIQHPDGYVSHYGHLSGYAEPIAQYVKDLQYKMKSYEVEIFPPAGLIKVTKGQVIAYSGNSGGSTGPHLHFEIRDSTNSYVLNPLLFGIKIADTKKPVLEGVRLYSGNNVSGVSYPVKKNKYGAYYMSSSTLYAKNGWGIAYKAIDPQDGSGFKNSVHHAQLYVDDKLVFEMILDKMKIDDQRSSDYHMDYSWWIETSEYYEKLFPEPGNALPIYTPGLTFPSYLTVGTHTIKIKLADFYKNTTEFSFNLNYSADAIYDQVYPAMRFDQLFTTSTTGNELKITIEPNTLYYNMYDKMVPTITSTQNEVGEMNFTFGTKYIPVRYPYKMEIKVNHSKIPIDKLCLVYYNKEGKMKYYSPVSYNENSITVEVKDMGSFSVWADTTRPVIKKISVKDSTYVMYNSKIVTTATDNLSDVCKYNAYFDGVWHLTEYEYKEDKLTTKIPDGLAVGWHTFEIEVLDDRKNRSYRKMTIFITKDENDLAKNKKK